jgi:hypothetical protein
MPWQPSVIDRMAVPLPGEDDREDERDAIPRGLFGVAPSKGQSHGVIRACVGAGRHRKSGDSGL